MQKSFFKICLYLTENNIFCSKSSHPKTLRGGMPLPWKIIPDTDQGT